MDSHEGHDEIPLSLREYLFAGADPIDASGPSGNKIDEVIGSALRGSPALHGNRPFEPSKALRTSPATNLAAAYPPLLTES